MALLHIYGNDVLNTVAALTYARTETLADGTSVTAGQAVDLTNYLSGGFFGEARAWPGSEAAQKHPDDWKITLQVSLFGDPVFGKVRIYASDTECFKPQANGFGHLERGLFDVFGTEDGTNYKQMLWQGSWVFHHAATQPEGY